MQCREFQEISEAYLSDELLVETNLQVFRHLENCPKCREEFAAKRELRQKIRCSVKDAAEYQIDSAFADKLCANLRKSALEKNLRQSLFAPRFLIPAMASLLIAVTLGFAVFNWTNKSENLALASDSLTKGLTQISITAVGSHKHCAMDNLQLWEKRAKQDYAQKAVYNERVIKPLQANFSEKIEMIHAHDCDYEGKQFTHVILQKSGKIVSVFFDNSDVMPETDSSATAKIICDKENGLQVASFQKDKRAIFVISSLTESENLIAARALSESWKNIQL